jgi:hypothetical protein
VEVVHDLCEDPRPVDGVNRTELEGRVDVWVGKEGFYDVLNGSESTVRTYTRQRFAHLAVIKVARHREVVDVFVEDRRHLQLLYGTNAPFGV